jgi:hypothetical protein
MKPGDRVRVTLIKGGYWKGTQVGNVVRVNGDRVTVSCSRWARARTFLIRNVEAF